MQPLEDIKVLDLTQMLAGPLASMYLGDLGAEVIKVEQPEKGDFTRQNPPFVDDYSGYFGSLNRNKNSITLDLADFDGYEILTELAQDADIIIENFKLGTVEKLEIDYSDMQKENTDIIYCSIKAFGRDSPYRGLPAFDILMQAMSGVMGMTGEEDGPPLMTKVPIGDIAASMFATQAILTALYSRDVNNSGGEFIEISMLNSLLSWIGPRAAHSIIEDIPYPRTGNNHPSFAPYGIFPTKDSYICLALASGNFWDKFCNAINRPDLVDDPLFSSMDQRTENRDQLESILTDTFEKRETDEWFEILRNHNIPAGPVYDTLEVWNDPHVVNQSMLEKLPVPDSDSQIPLIRYPVSFSSFESDSSPPQKLGESTEHYLRKLGYSDERIIELKKKGTI